MLRVMSKGIITAAMEMLLTASATMQLAIGHPGCTEQLLHPPTHLMTCPSKNKSAHAVLAKAPHRRNAKEAQLPRVWTEASPPTA